MGDATQSTIYGFDPYTYGQSGGEFDFGLTKTLPAFDPTQPPSPPPPGKPPQPKPPGGGTGGNGGVPAGASWMDKLRALFHQHPALQQQQNFQGQPFQFPAMPQSPGQPSQPGMQFPPQMGGGLGGQMQAPAQGSPRNFADGGAITPPSGLNNNLQYLMSGLGSLAQPQNNPSQAPAPPSGIQPNYNQNGGAQGGPGNQDDPGGTFSRENVSAHPNLKNSLAMAGMVAGLGNPLNMGLSLGAQALMGNSPLTADLGPRLAPQDIQAVSDAWTNTPGPLTNKMAAASKVLQGARDKYGLPPGLTKSDIMEVTPGDMKFGLGPMGSVTSGGGSVSGRGNSGGGGGGGSYGGGSLGGGPGAMGAGHDPSGPPGGWATGGIIHLMRR